MGWHVNSKYFLFEKRTLLFTVLFELHHFIVDYECIIIYYVTYLYIYLHKIVLNIHNINIF